MDIENLVSLRQGTTTLKLGHSDFKQGKFYRCLPDGDGYIIFGEWVTKADYDTYFELAHTRVLRDFKALKLVTEDGKPLSKTAFKSRASIHTYTGGRGTKVNPLRIWFFWLSHPKDLMYAFYPERATSANNLKECYEMYLKLIAGDMEDLDMKDVVAGNSGVPLAYGEIYFR